MYRVFTSVVQNLLEQPAQVEASITPSTIAVYASAPSFPHGVVDPVSDQVFLFASLSSDFPWHMHETLSTNPRQVEALATITRTRHIGLHVDNCLGQ